MIDYLVPLKKHTYQEQRDFYQSLNEDVLDGEHEEKFKDGKPLFYDDKFDDFWGEAPKHAL